MGLALTREDTGWRLVRLDATDGNKRKAADILGITRRTLYRWIE